MRRRQFALLALALPALLAACTDSSPDSESPSTTTDDHEEADPGTPTGPATGPIPSDQPAAASSIDTEAATAAARATADAWVQGKTLDQTTWADQLRPTLMPVVQDEYTAIWGYKVDQTQIIGDPEVTDATELSCTVTFPTDAGALTIAVQKDSDTSIWLTRSITTQD